MASTLRKEWDLWRGNGRGSYGDVSSELLLMMRDWGISMKMLMGGLLVEPTKEWNQEVAQEADRTNQQLLLASNTH